MVGLRQPSGVGNHSKELLGSYFDTPNPLEGGYYG